MPRRSPLPVVLVLVLAGGIGDIGMGATVATAALAGTSPPATADSFITVKTHTDAFEMMGQKEAAKDTETRIWLAADRARRDEGDASQVVRFDRNKLYLLHHKDKTYNELDLPIDWRKLTPKGSEAAVEQMTKAMTVSARMTPTAEVRKIAGWNTMKIQIEITNTMGMKVDNAMWVSKEIPIYPVYNKLTACLAALQPGAGDWERKLGAIEGFPVLQETTVSAIGAHFKSREELIAVEARQAPAGTYEIPAGYTVVAWDPMSTLSGLQ
ncbi:MAG: DUF4412 domain-containing protein [Acidobacteriota bacterium]|nr:DUF4412 domain-containing protein [Acidobacteriota bacterium]